MKLKIPTKIEVKDSPIHGLGVFAIERIEKDEIIEECHLITFLVGKDTPDLLIDHRFSWPQAPMLRSPSLPFACIALGCGCIYNHSDNNNAKWIDHPQYKAFQFVATKDIEEGEEICTNYGSDYVKDSRWEGKKEWI